MFKCFQKQSTGQWGCVDNFGLIHFLIRKTICSPKVLQEKGENNSVCDIIDVSNTDCDLIPAYLLHSHTFTCWQFLILFKLLFHFHSPISQNVII